MTAFNSTVLRLVSTKVRGTGFRFGCAAALSLFTLTMLHPEVAYSATVFTNNLAAGANWSVPGNWNNGVPGMGNPGTINTPAIAIADVALTTADITVTTGGSLRLLAVGNVANSVLIQSGGILQHAGTNPGGTAITFNNGARLGKNVANGGATTANAITVPASGTLFANALRGDGRVDNAPIGLTLTGVLSAGNTSSILHVQPTMATDAPLNINPAVVNNPFNGTAVVEGGAGAPGYLILQGTGALINATDIDVRAGGVLRFQSTTNAIGLPSVTIGAGRRVEWDGTSSYTGTPLNLNLLDGAILGKWRTNSTGAVNESLSIATNSTAYASFIRGDGRADDQGLMLRHVGVLGGDSTTVLRIQPDASIAANAVAGFDIAPVALSNPFAGSVVVQANSNGARGILGVGNGALVNATGLSINAGGTLRFLGNSINPFNLSLIPSVTISAGARAEWLGTNTYAGTPITLNMAGGSAMGKHVTNSSGTSRENIILGAGTITVNEIGNTNTVGEPNRPAEAYALNLAGNLSGGVNSRLLVQPAAVGPNFAADQFVRFNGVLNIAPTAPAGNTGMLGTVELLGQPSLGFSGILIIRNNSPLGSSDVIVGQGGLLDVRASSLSNVESVSLDGTGQVRFRNNSGSTLSNTTLSGNGLIRSESVPASTTTSNLLSNTAALQSLALSDITFNTDNAAGTLTFQTTTLSIDAASVLKMELGAAQNDLLAVEGNLDLSAMPALELSDLGDLGPGVYTIASYTGSLSGTFGTISNLTGLDFVGINYGSGTGSIITVEFAPLPAPEPSALWLVAAGMGLLSARRRRKQ